MEQNIIEAGFEKVWRLFQETDKKFQETDKKFQETDKRLKELMEGLKKLEDTFITRWGKFMEVLVNSGASSALRRSGLDVNHSAKNVVQETYNGVGRGMEIDVLCWGKEVVVPIEVKSTLKVEDVDEHIERLGRFFECFPRFRGMTLYGGVAGLDFAGDADRYAYKKGLYVLTLKGNKVVDVSNDGKFRPKIWG